MLKLTTLCRNLKSICTATWVIWTDLYNIEIFVTKCTEADDITKKMISQVGDIVQCTYKQHR